MFCLTGSSWFAWNRSIRKYEFSTISFGSTLRRIGGRRTDRPTDWLIDCLISKLAGWLAARMIDLLDDWIKTIRAALYRQQKGQLRANIRVRLLATFSSSVKYNTPGWYKQPSVVWPIGRSTLYLSVFSAHYFSRPKVTVRQRLHTPHVSVSVSTCAGSPWSPGASGTVWPAAADRHRLRQPPERHQGRKGNGCGWVCSCP